MPIRIVPDKRAKRKSSTPTRQRSSGGGGLSSLLPLLLSFLLKKPKLLIPVLIIGAILYFGKGMLFKDSGGPSVVESLFTGAEMSEEKYDEAPVFAALADNINNTLPERVSLEKYCPTRRNQGAQGSCVGWSSGYAARTILEAQATGKSPNEVAFSPASLYNQISLPGCQGAYIINAMKTMQQTGVLPWADHPYDESSCDATMNVNGMRKAANYRMKGFNRLTPNGDPRGVDLLAIKQNLAQGAPVVIGMMVGGSFMAAMRGQKSWTPTRSDYNMSGFGGHAMCVIGYDDYLNDGSFQIMNSWGSDWGKNGLAWVSYKDFDFFTKEAYGVHPMGNAENNDPYRFQMAFSLINQADSKLIPLNYVSNNLFQTASAIPKLTKFKIQVNNNIACYTYIFGQETDGSSYVLFPYTKKHSPYCGITGTRIFPKDASLQADELGSKDFFAIVVSKTPLDYNQLNERINGSRGSSYQSKVQAALSSTLKNVRYQSNKDQIVLDTNTDGDQVVATIIAVNKQ